MKNQSIIKLVVPARIASNPQAMREAIERQQADAETLAFITSDSEPSERYNNEARALGNLLKRLG